jgi:hypothetical protein
MPITPENKPPLSSNQISWILTIGALVLVLPYAVGFLYAIFALPLYAVACQSETSRDVIIGQVAKHIRPEDYLTFLAGKGCVAPPPQRPPPEVPCPDSTQPGYDPQCMVNQIIRRSLQSIDERYRGVHRYFNDDLIGRLFSYMGDAYFKAAVKGSEFAVDLHDKNPLFRAFAWVIVGAGVLAGVTFVRRLSTRIADAIFDRWKGGL